jgi:hypothetical protein
VPAPPHVLRGDFTIRKDSVGLVFETSPDFLFDGSPAPGFAFHTAIPTIASDPALRADMAKTRFLDLPGNVVEVGGIQIGALPVAIDIGTYKTLVLWCFADPSTLGYGTLERP